jgi:putative exporter of polyketide antibiotics
MSLYTDIFAGVVTWTNRPDLTAETDLAIKQAIRTAHRAGSFPRDLQSAAITGLSLDQIQSIDLTTVAPDFRQVATLGPTGLDLQYNPILVTDLFDQDAYPRTDVFWGIGTAIMVRAAVPVAAMTLVYYKQPVVSPIADTTSWIADIHQDLIILWAAATVLSFIGEQEVKARVEALAKLAYSDLVEDSLEIVRR